MTAQKLKSSKAQKQKGFTLIEVLVASTIFAFISIMGVGIFAQTTRVSDKIEADRQVQQAARFAFEQMSRTIRVASAIGLMSASPLCPGDFTVPSSGSGNSKSCSSRAFADNESYGIPTGGSCLAKSPDKTFGAPVCMTPPTVQMVGSPPLVFSAYAPASPTDPAFDQKPYIKIRATFQATTQPQGVPPKSFTFETLLVARNFEKQY